MRKLFLIVLIFFLTISALIKPVYSNAAGECGTLTASTNTANQLAAVGFTITGATAYAGKTLYIRIYDASDGHFLSSGEGQIKIDANGSGSATLFKGVIDLPGSYSVRVFTTPISSLNDPSETCAANSVNLAVTGKVPGPLKGAGDTTQQQNNDVGCDPGTHNKSDGIDTAIGCIPINNTNALVNFILRWALGIAGGIAFLLILVAGFQITTSRGDPNRLKAGQELLTSAIAGLVLLIFSIFILRVIGFNILGITAFGGK